MSKTLENPEDAIGHKIRWNSWDGSYFLLERVNGRDLYGTLYSDYKNFHRDRFVLGKGIKHMTDGQKETSYWYLIEEHRAFKIPKLDDELFEI